MLGELNVEIDGLAAVGIVPIDDLGPTVGEQTVVSSGFELVDVGVAVERAIVGGTGRYETVGGTQTQTLLGWNNPQLVVDGIPLFGVSLGVTLVTR